MSLFASVSISPFLVCLVLLWLAPRCSAVSKSRTMESQLGRKLETALHKEKIWSCQTVLPYELLIRAPAFVIVGLTVSFPGPGFHSSSYQDQACPQPQPGCSLLASCQLFTLSLGSWIMFLLSIQLHSWLQKQDSVTVKPHLWYLPTPKFMMTWKSQQTREQEQHRFSHEQKIYGKISQSLQLIYKVTGFLCVLEFSRNYLSICLL